MELGPVQLGGTEARAREEHLAFQRRYRMMLQLALLIWPLLAVADWLISAYLAPVGFGRDLVLRVVCLSVLLVAVLVTRRELSPRALRLGEILVIGSLSASIVIDGVRTGGIASPMLVGMILLLLARGLVAADHWRQGLAPIGSMVVTALVVVAVMAWRDPAVAAQFGQPQPLASFIFGQGMLFGGAVLSIIGGHIMWGLRQQLYEARSLGRYRLIRRLGAGAMGEVWLARHHALKQEVAIKILRSRLEDRGVAAARFEREARATAELNHPNTVRVFDYGLTDDGLYYYAMERLDGIDLGRWVSERGRLEPGLACQLVAQAARGLGAAHAQGLVHRDVKPENLMVVRLADGTDLVKVVDFGLVRQAEEAATLTSSGVAMGTPLWVAPEVVQGEQADARTDVYGLGAVLYFLLTGAAPFAGRDLSATLLAHLQEVPPPPSTVAPAVTPAIDALVLRCLDKDPAHRFASGRELAAALDPA